MHRQSIRAAQAVADAESWPTGDRAPVGRMPWGAPHTTRNPLLSFLLFGLLWSRTGARFQPAPATLTHPAGRRSRPEIAKKNGSLGIQGVDRRRPAPRGYPKPPGYTRSSPVNRASATLAPSIHGGAGGSTPSDAVEPKKFDRLRRSQWSPRRPSHGPLPGRVDTSTRLSHKPFPEGVHIPDQRSENNRDQRVNCRGAQTTPTENRRRRT